MNRIQKTNALNLLIHAQSFDKCSLFSLASAFIDAHQRRSTALGEPLLSLPIQSIKNSLSVYLRGKNSRASVYGFYLVNPPSPVCPVFVTGSSNYVKEVEFVPL